MKRFDLETVLNITTEYFLGGDFGKVYSILDYLTGDNLFTHQLPRAGRECRPWILRAYPELGTADLRALDVLLERAETKEAKAAARKTWLAQQRIEHGWAERYALEPMPSTHHERKNPVAEMIEMRGGTRDMIVV